MDREYICTFKSNDKYILDYAKSIRFIKNIQIFCMLFLPLCLYSMLISFRNDWYTLTIMCAIVFVIWAIMLFIYPYILKAALKKNSRLRYGNEEIIKKITFSDKIYIETKEDRVVLEYKNIKVIKDSPSVICLFISQSTGTYFPKGSCVNADDDELIAFLLEKTGAKLKKRTSKLFIILSVISAIVSAILLIIFFLYLSVSQLGI